MKNSIDETQTIAVS